MAQKTTRLERLFAYRDSAGLNNSSLARAIGINPGTIYAWKRAGDVNPSSAERVDEFLSVQESSFQPEGKRSEKKKQKRKTRRARAMANKTHDAEDIVKDAVNADKQNISPILRAIAAAGPLNWSEFDDLRAALEKHGDKFDTRAQNAFMLALTVVRNKPRK